MRLKNGDELVRQAGISRALAEASKAIAQSIGVSDFEGNLCKLPRPFQPGTDWLFLTNSLGHGLGWRVGDECAGAAKATWNVRVAAGLAGRARNEGWTLSKTIHSIDEWAMSSISVTESLPHLDIAVRSTDRNHLADLSNLNCNKQGILEVSIPSSIFRKGTKVQGLRYPRITFPDRESISIKIVYDLSGLKVSTDGAAMNDVDIDGLTVELGTVTCTAAEIAAFAQGSKLDIAVTWPVPVRLRVGDTTIAVAVATVKDNSLTLEIQDVFLRGSPISEETFAPAKRLSS